ncbi:DUF368 domain-containing protein [bacterium D16-51]|nr:DUF368 domain-containing protein [bacterium D16-59]RKI62648.1 DUF368 domain-containing protein [bacterium D16-51]
MQLFINIVRGFCMALADSVPGVSGGTVAFILGFYDKFIGSLAYIVNGTKDERKDAVFFLLKLLAGWLIGFCLSVLVLGKIFNTHIYELSSLFMGLSVFALPIVIMEEKEVLKEKKQNVFFTIVGIVIVALITYLNASGREAGAVDIAHLSVGTAVYIFLVAMVAISAMVLPGISGSTLLLIFGLYVPIISAIKEFLHFNFTYFWALVLFGLGMIAGILTIIKLVRAGLEKHRGMMVYLILGLMLGALYAIVMGPTTLDVPKPAMTVKTFHPIFFLLGGIILFGLQKLKGISEAKQG